MEHLGQEIDEEQEKILLQTVRSLFIRYKNYFNNVGQHRRKFITKYKKWLDSDFIYPENVLQKPKKMLMSERFEVLLSPKSERPEKKIQRKITEILEKRC